MRSRVIIDFIQARSRQFLLFAVCLLYFSSYKAQQIGNYVANGSFEDYYQCVPMSVLYPITNAKNWFSVDPVYPAVFMSGCNGFTPAGFYYQHPRSGQSYILTNFYYPAGMRFYSKNVLKSILQADKTYCVKFYVSITNYSRCGIDGFGAYFGGNEIDTITKGTVPLTYITPQVQNLQGNIISDTVKWVAITGTFTANGTEKYLVLGNFLSDNNTSTVIINPTNPENGTDLYIDDVSCIEVGLPAYAGRDTTILIGDSAYIGREPDFAIDSGCVWYQLPDMTTAIDTISGMWVKPTVTTTYVVRQELECSAVKWDTVVVGVGYVGLNELTIDDLKLKVYPNPANNVITIESNNANEELIISIADVTGRIVAEQKVQTQNFSVDMNLYLANGAYMLNISNSKSRTFTKKLLIAK